MRRVPALLTAAVLLALPLAWPARGDAEPSALTLTGIDKLTGLQRADTDGDGVLDLLLLSGRTLQVYGLAGEAGKRTLGTKPRTTWTVPEDVSFVIGPHPGLRGGAGAKERVAWLGTSGLGGPPGASAAPASQALRDATRASVRWRDGEQATFADFDRGPNGWIVPTPDGWLHEDGMRLPIARARRVMAPGPFLEDTCTVEDALPHVFVGREAGAGSGRAIWAIADRALIAAGKDGRVAYDLSFLTAGDGEDFDQTLVDLDGDDRPEILHRIYTNRQVHYGLFRTRPAQGATGPSHKPANCRLSLQGFQLDPEFVDLDADGRKDLIITSMQVNAANMMGALSKGLVVAETRAFLNRSAKGETYFVATPDANVQSEIGVKVRFNQAGNIEVVRTLMIVADGDYDGDGRKDLAIRTGPETVRIHPGRADGVWADAEGARSVAIPPMGDSPDVEGYAADLDGDRRDELVLVYRAPPGGKDIVRILRP